MPCCGDAYLYCSWVEKAFLCMPFLYPGRRKRKKKEEVTCAYTSTYALILPHLQHCLLHAFWFVPFVCCTVYLENMYRFLWEKEGGTCLWKKNSVVPNLGLGRQAFNSQRRQGSGPGSGKKRKSACHLPPSLLAGNMSWNLFPLRGSGWMPATACTARPAGPPGSPLFFSLLPHSLCQALHALAEMAWLAAWHCSSSSSLSLSHLPLP